jgi:hypothetical protein
MSNKAFCEKIDFGNFCLSTSQVDKTLTFDWDTEVIDACKIKVFKDNTLIKEYVEGVDLERSNLNKTITLTLQGSDFKGYIGNTLEFRCNFFNLGDEEVVFSFNIIKGEF